MLLRLYATNDITKVRFEPIHKCTEKRQYDIITVLYTVQHATLCTDQKGTMPLKQQHS